MSDATAPRTSSDFVVVYMACTHGHNQHENLRVPIWFCVARLCLFLFPFDPVLAWLLSDYWKRVLMSDLIACLSVFFVFFSVWLILFFNGVFSVTFVSLSLILLITQGLEQRRNPGVETSTSRRPCPRPGSSHARG